MTMAFKQQQFPILFYITSTIFLFLAWDASVGVKADFYWSIKNDPDHSNECMRIVEEVWAKDKDFQTFMCQHYHNKEKSQSMGISGFHDVWKTGHHIMVLKCENKDNIYDRMYFFPRRGDNRFVCLYPCKYQTDPHWMKHESICTYDNADQFDEPESPKASPKKTMNPMKSLKRAGSMLKRSLSSSSRNSQRSSDDESPKTSR